MRVFTECPLTNRTDPLVRAMITEPAFIKGYITDPTITDQAKAAVAYLKTMPPGYRGLSMGGWFFAGLTRPLSRLPAEWQPQIPDGTPPFKRSYPLPLAPNALRDFQQGRVLGQTWEIARLKELGDALATTDIAIDWIDFDYEDGYSYFGLDAATIAAICGDYMARSHFPPLLLAITPNGKVPVWGTPEGRAFVIEFNRHAASINAWMVRDALAHAGLAWQHDVGDKSTNSPTVVNFLWSRSGAFPVYDVNGWPEDQENSLDVHGTSCPGCYLNSGPHRYPVPALSKDPTWNGLIEDMNHIRSLAAVGPVCPVIETDWNVVTRREVSTDALIGHAVRTGVETFDYFNPPEATAHGEEYKLAVMLAKHSRYVAQDRLKLPEIPLDADRIETNGYVTTYADWLTGKIA